MTVREQIVNSLDKFLANCKNTFTAIANVVDNCASTSTTMPLSANQGKVLQDQITELNTEMKYKLSTDPKRLGGELRYDRNYFFSPGLYNCTIANSKNMPSNESYGTVLTLSANTYDGLENPNSDTWMYQLFFSTSATEPNIYIRKNINYTYTGWSDWMKFA